MDFVMQGLKRLPRISIRPAIALLLCCSVAAGLAYRLHPTQSVDRGRATLSAVLLPSAGGWREVKSGLVQMSLTPEGVDRSEALAATYDDTAMTSYVDGQGNVVMVALAYGRSQRQEGKIHRPELCYSAQGYGVQKFDPVPLSGLASDAAEKVQIHRLEANSRHRREIVSYWIRIGDLFSTSAFQTRAYLMKTGLQGRIPDGILFRVSQIVPGDLAGVELEKAYARQEEFMTTLATSLRGDAQEMLLGDRLTTRLGAHHAAT